MRTTTAAALALISLSAWGTACSSGESSRSTVNDGGTAGTGGAGTGGVIPSTGGTGAVGGIGGGGGSTSVPPIPWPTEPVIDGGAPANAADLFAGAASGTGPCIHEPQTGSMIPRNWLRPRVRVAPAGGETLFQYTFSSDAADNDLVVYSDSSTFTMEGGHWAYIAQRAQSEVTVNLTVRATAAGGGAVSESTSSFIIAPSDAGGSMVYWATKQSGNTLDATKLVGFSVGEEGTVDALLPSQVQESGFLIEDGTVADYGAGSGKTSCIGCHTSTPDGGAVAFNGNWPWFGAIASVEEASVGARPAYVTNGAAAAIKMPFLGGFTFSPAQWAEGGGGIAISVIQDPKDYEGWNMWDGSTRNIVPSAELAWFDLRVDAAVTPGDVSVDGQRGTLWDTIPRTGDTGAVANPNWSHDGTSIAYASCAQVAGGHPGGLAADGVTPLTTATECDIYKVPFADGAGGPATAVAAEQGAAEYYPDFSYDDALIAYTRAPTNTGYHYYRADGEIYVTPANGGEAHRLAANDPPACSGQTSPGVINSWPKWSPSSSSAGGKNYYWLIFSSGRSYPEQFDLPADQWTPAGLDRRASQLYLAAVVVDGGGAITSYAATYIWNQTKDTANLTPAWDEFKIPPVILK